MSMTLFRLIAFTFRRYHTIGVMCGWWGGGGGTAALRGRPSTRKTRHTTEDTIWPFSMGTRSMAASSLQVGPFENNQGRTTGGVRNKARRSAPCLLCPFPPTTITICLRHINHVPHRDIPAPKISFRNGRKAKARRSEMHAGKAWEQAVRPTTRGAHLLVSSRPRMLAYKDR